MITVTDSAVAKIKDIIAEENNPSLKLRVFVQGGGCSGMQYGFTLDEDVGEDDWTLDINGIQILVDSMSGQYLQGSNWIYLSKSGQIKTIHNHAKRTDIALLVDWWEHAWVNNYGSNKEKYLDNLWRIMDWDAVNRRL